MKSRNDPRHQHREHLLQLLYTWDFRKDGVHKDIEEIMSHMTEIDTRIVEAAPLWPIDKMARVDLAILRLAVWELYFSNLDTPAKVVVDEAIELGKEYGSESTFSFVNGALGSLLKRYPKEDQSVEE